MTNFFSELKRRHIYRVGAASMGAFGKLSQIARCGVRCLPVLILCGCEAVESTTQFLAPLVAPPTNRAIIGPTSAQEFPQLVLQAVPFDAGTVVIAAEGNLHPDAADTRSLLRAQVVPGVVAVTTESVLFMRWDPMRERYRVELRVQFMEIRDARIDTVLGTPWVAMDFETPEATLHVGFEFHTNNGSVPNSDKVREAGEYIRAHFAGGGTSAPIPGATVLNASGQRVVVRSIRFFENGTQQTCGTWTIADTESVNVEPDRRTERWIVDRCGERIRYRVTLFAPGVSPLPGASALPGENVSVQLE